MEPGQSPLASKEASRDGLRSTCGRCGAELRRSAYEVRRAADTVLRCLRCALMHWPMVQRSLLISLVVGTLLTAINQGNLIVQGEIAASLAWKVPLTYLVPYCVATTGAVLNTHRPVAT